MAGEVYRVQRICEAGLISRRWALPALGKQALRSTWLRGLLDVLRPRLLLSRSPSPREALGAVLRWVWRNRYEILAVGVVTGVGAFLRLYRLDGIPAGVSGDEATSGLRADAILQRHWAGPYDRYHAYGQPAGTEFWMAGMIGLFGSSVFVIRMSMAVLAIAALPLAYLLFRVVDCRTTAIIGASLLALSSWHLVFSRIAAPPAAVTTTELLASLVLVLALRSGKWWLFPIAGIVLALGIYVYNGYFYFLFGVAAVLVGWLVAQRAALPRAALGVALLAAAFFLTAWPMLSFVREYDDVSRYARDASIFNSSSFEEASGLLERTDVVLDSGRDFVKLAVFEGARDVPMLAVATSVLLGFGVLYAFRRWREPGVALALVLVLLIPWTAILNPGAISTPTGMMRRCVGVTPYVAFLAALPLSVVLRSRYLAAPPLRAVALVATAAAIVSVGVANIGFYFRDYAHSPRTRPNYQLVQAARYLDDLPGDTYVYFYSKGYEFEYEARRFLMPDVEGENRSGLWGSQFDLRPDRRTDVVYLFLDAFLDTSDVVQRLYPGGHAFDSIDEDGRVLFRAYHLPGTADVDRELPPPAATPAGEAGTQPLQRAPEVEEAASTVERNQIRRQHLE